MAFDILIKNASIVDGTGAAAYPGSIAVYKGIIQEIGQNVPEEAKLMIDAKERIVAPGFIDITNHSDAVGTLFSEPALPSMLIQGVTTIMGGNCGASLAPLLYPGAINSLQKWRTETIQTVDWLTMGDFLKSVEKIKPGVNFGTMTGFGLLRRGILKNEDREFDFEDLKELKYVLEESLKEGSFGLSTGLVYAHERASTTEDLVRIAEILKKYDAVYKTHLRSESGGLLGAVNEAVAIARNSGARVSVSHFKGIGRKAWRDFDLGLSILERAAHSGAPIAFDVYPYITTGSFLYLLLPPGAYDGGFSKLWKRLKDPSIRQSILKSMQEKTLHYETIVISTAWKTKEAVGKNIRDIAERIGISPEEVVIHLLLANEGRVTMFGHTVQPELVKKALLHPLSIIASDGAGYSLEHRKTGELVHPRSFGTFPRFLRLAVNKWSELGWPEAIRKMTSAPAELFGIQKRGTLAKGNHADIVIIDRDAVASQGTFENPYQYPRGIDWVIVNGVVAVNEGQFQNARAGKVLRRGEK